MRRLAIVALLAGLLAVVAPSAHAAAAAAAPAARPRVDLRVVSGRADLVTGGDTLVEVRVRRAADLARVRLRNGHRVLTGRLVRTSPTTARALVRGLPRGRSRLTASLPSGHVARLGVTNRPDTGPVVSGPQVRPWICDTAGAANSTASVQPNVLGPSSGPACRTRTVSRLYYKPRLGTGFLPYDPARTPAALVASTTTQTGVTMPFVVRIEQGVQNRGIYSIAALVRPGQRWTPFARPRHWNGKVLAVYGGGNSPGHRQGLNQSVLDENALGLGWLVAGSGLMVQGHQNNPVVAAESLMMLKEHIVETHGPINFTIGQGCSGGGIMQDYAASQYPGLLDGLMVQCNYLDLWTTAPEVIDCYLLTQLVGRRPALAGAVRASIGYQDMTTCQAWNLTFASVLDPGVEGNCDLPAAQVYDPATHPGGVRCTMQDYASQIWGERPRAEWGPQERRLGRGFAPLPQSNVGVVYGLKALRRGTITADDFVAMNAGVGGLDVDRVIRPHRTGVDAATLRTAYRTSQVTDGRQLARLPILDLRAGANTFEVHTPVGSRILRARLQAQAGSAANHVIWTFPATAPLVGVLPPRAVADQALAAMDRWVSGINRRGGFGSPHRVAAARPASLVDTCFVGLLNRPVTDAATCARTFPVFSTPRLEAGMPTHNSVIACRRKPLVRSDLPVAFTAEQWTTLRRTFPSGVCDYRRPGIGQRPSVPWQSYAAGPGGRALGPAPGAIHTVHHRTPGRNR